MCYSVVSLATPRLFAQHYRSYYYRNYTTNDYLIRHCNLFHKVYYHEGTFLFFRLLCNIYFKFLTYQRNMHKYEMFTIFTPHLHTPEEEQKFYVRDARVSPTVM